MSDLYIRSIAPSELKYFYPRIESDFAAGEYPPMDVLYDHMLQGKQEGYALWDGNKYVAYSFWAANPARNHILITLLAVMPEYRGQGMGTNFLKKLHEMMNEGMVIVEVEKPEEAKTDKERDKRLRRIAFYEKEGYILINEIDYIIWDIPMHLMVRLPEIHKPLNNPEVMEIMQQIYFRLLGKRFINKLQIKDTSGENNESA
jgi:GNAT superfamily N-acetyltransferase